MNNNQDSKKSETDAEIEREIREGRKFTLAEAIGRLAGPGAMKGVSPIPRKQQAEVEIESYLGQHLADSSGALRVVLLRRIKGSQLSLENYTQPLVVLASYCQQILGSDFGLKDFVREVDTEWGRLLGERPYFESEGSPPHPDDEYTIESVRTDLLKLVERLTAV